MVSKIAVDKELLHYIWILSDLASGKFFCFCFWASLCQV